MRLLIACLLSIVAAVVFVVLIVHVANDLAANMRQQYPTIQTTSTP